MKLLVCLSGVKQRSLEETRSDGSSSVLMMHVLPRSAEDEGVLFSAAPIRLLQLHTPPCFPRQRRCLSLSARSDLR